MAAGVFRFRVDQFDGSTYLVSDSLLNMEFCMCADESEQSQGMKAETRAKLIADALNSQWKADQEMFASNWQTGTNP